MQTFADEHALGATERLRETMKPDLFAWRAYTNIRRSLQDTCLAQDIDHRKEAR